MFVVIVIVLTIMNNSTVKILVLSFGESKDSVDLDPSGVAVS